MEIIAVVNFYSVKDNDDLVLVEATGKRDDIRTKIWAYEVPEEAQAANYKGLIYLIPLIDYNSFDPMSEPEPNTDFSTWELLTPEEVVEWRKDELYRGL